MSNLTRKEIIEDAIVQLGMGRSESRVVDFVFQNAKSDRQANSILKVVFEVEEIVEGYA